MSKTVQEARSFFKKSVQTESNFVEGFESVSSIVTPTIAIPITINLTDQEKRNIQKILVDDYQPGKISESQVVQHIEQLTNITKQIKSISAQSVLLHGERIKQAQNILKDYREGVFSKWLMTVYGNRQTPYSMLRFYEFYQSAPIDARPLIENMPKKAVYLLASRDGDHHKKIEIVKNHSTTPQSDLVLLIRETFPVDEVKKREPLNAATIKVMEKACSKLENRSKYLTEDDIIDIKKLVDRLQMLC